jgi:hypothetical protein
VASSITSGCGWWMLRRTSWETEGRRDLDKSLALQQLEDVINDYLGVSEFLSYALAVQPTRLRFLRMIDDVKGHRIDDALIVLNEGSSILFEPANLDGVAQWTLIGRAERLVIRPDVAPSVKHLQAVVELH